MTIESVLKLLIAVCIALEIRPGDLAAIFAKDDEIQDYFDLVLELSK